MERHVRAYPYAVISVLLWSSVATVFKLALAEISFIHLLFYSSLASTTALFLVLLFQNKLDLLLAQTGRQLAYSALVGLLNPFLYYLVLFKAYSILPAQIAQPLNYTWAIVLSVLSALILHQSMTKRDMLALSTGLLGVIILSTEGNFVSMGFSDPVGVLLALSSAFLWASMWILNMRDERDPVLKLFSGFLFGTVYITILTVVTTPPNASLLSHAGLFYAIYVGLFEMGITFVFWLKALNMSGKSSNVSLLVYISPFLSLVFIHFILGEEILISSLVGLLLIVAGIVFQKPLPRNLGLCE